MIEFTNTEAIVFKRKYLVISDLHLGIEVELLKKGFNIPPQTKQILSRIYKLKEKYNPKNLIILGDLKHNVPKTTQFEIREVLNFLKSVSKLFKRVYITKGNHDGGIKNIEIGNVRILKALKIKNVVFTHGHLKPKLKGKLYIIGHHHFVFPIKTSFGEVIYEKVLVLGENDYKVLILPAFSNLVGSWEVGSFHGPIARNIKHYYVLSLNGELLYEAMA